MREGINHFLEHIEPYKLATRSIDGNNVALTAETGGKITGVIEMLGWSRIRLFFVDREHHGKGIARMLFQETMRLCEEKGSEGIDVNPSPFAAPVYERLGFVRSGPGQVKNGISFIPMKMTL